MRRCVDKLRKAVRVMNGGADFYTCKLQSVVKCHYNCESWLRILRLAEHDEVTADASAVLVYGLDNCDLAPFLGGERDDSIYRLSRHDMVENLINASFGKPKVMVPPATLVEYIHSALVGAGKLDRLLREFDQFRDRKIEDFESLVWQKYEQIRRLIDAGPGVAGLEKLRRLLESGKLLTIESVLGRHWQLHQLTQCSVRSDKQAMQLLEERRHGQYSRFANLIDIANCNIFLALADVMGTPSHLYQMTTTGNLTLKACELSVPSGKLEDMPFRHLASPYIRIMIRQDEPGHQGRINKLRIGQLALKEALNESEKTSEVYEVTRGRLDANPNATVGVTKRFYDALRTWLDLIFFPYLRGLKEAQIAVEYPKGHDIGLAVDWVEGKRSDIKKSGQISRRVAKELGELAGLDSDEIVEHFVPDHPEALRIIEWLRS